MEEYINLITQCGFPIACTYLLYKELAASNANRSKDTEKFTEAINNNTKVLTILCERMNEHDLSGD